MGQDTGSRFDQLYKPAEADDPIFREGPEGPSSFTLPPGMTGTHLNKNKFKSTSEPDIAIQKADKEVEAVIDLTELEGWPKGYFDVIASDSTTAEQRADEDRDEYMCGPMGRLKMMLGHRGIPRNWVVEYGWPRVLDKIREYAVKNNIKLIEPDAYLTFGIKPPFV
jgi:hypothetical protein